jgi:hypothetical protein
MWQSDDAPYPEHLWPKTSARVLCFALLLLLSTTAVQALRADGREQAILSVPWHRALFLQPGGRLLIASLVISLCAICGGLPVAVRLIWGKTVTPGELLLFIMGMQQLAQLVVVVGWYRYEPFEIVVPPPKPQPIYWIPSGLAGVLASLLAVTYYCSVAGWRLVFGLTFVLFGLFLWVGPGLDHDGAAKQVLVTPPTAVLLCCVAVIAGWMALSSSQGYPGWPGRRLAHWVGLLVCSLPLIWFGPCFLFGPRNPLYFFFAVSD